MNINFGKKVEMWGYGLILGISFSTMAFAAGDPEHGQEIMSGTCAACHNADGNSSIPEYPKLAGQHDKYLIKSLEEFRAGPDGPRNNPIMFGMVSNMSDQDFADIAAFLSTQTMTIDQADVDLVEQGRMIYLGGDLDTGVTACAACHGPTGLGNDPAGFPRLAGQHADYIAAQLEEFKEHERTGDPDGMMQDIAGNLTDEQIQAVASYISGLEN